MSYMLHQESKNTTRFYPKNLNKFKSKSDYCVCRSSWEVKFCKWADSNDQILMWASEPIGIPYFDAARQKERTYYPDYLIKVIDKKTRLEKVWLVEVKPENQCKPPVVTKGKSRKTRLHEAATFATNKSKWQSALQYCKLKGWTFKIITERDLF